MEKAKSRSSIYKLDDTLIVPAVALTHAGYYLEIEPVKVISLADEMVLELLAQFLERPNIRIPTPEGGAAFPKPVVLKHSPFRSWKAFAAAVESWAIDNYAATLVIEHYRRTGNAFYPGKRWTIDVDASGELLHVRKMIELITTDSDSEIG